jgi:hypothetical protein
VSGLVTGGATLAAVKDDAQKRKQAVFWFISAAAALVALKGNAESLREMAVIGKKVVRALGSGNERIDDLLNVRAEDFALEAMAAEVARLQEVQG